MENSLPLATRSASPLTVSAKLPVSNDLLLLHLFVLTVPLMSVVVFYKIQPSFVVGFVGLIGLCMRKSHGRKHREMPLVPKVLRIFFGVAVVSSCMSFAIPHIGSFMGETPFLKSFKQVFQLAFMIALLAWIISTVNTQAKLRSVVKYIYIAALIVCLYGFYQFVGISREWPLATGFENPAFPLTEGVSGRANFLPGSSGTVYEITRIYSTASEPGFFANFLLLPFSLSLTGVLTGKGLRQKNLLFEYVVLGIVTVVLVLTFSRAGYLSAVVSLLCVLFTVMRRGKRKRIALMLVATTMLAVLGISATNVLLSSGGGGDAGSLIVEMFQRLSDPLDPSTFDRINASVAAIRMFVDYPLLGVGIGNYGFFFGSYAPSPESETWPSAQSLYLGIMAEMGIVGLFAFLSFLVWTLRRGAKVLQNPGSNPYLRAMAIGLLGALVGMYYQMAAIYALNFVHTWLCLALMIAAWRISTGIAHAQQA